MKERADRTAPPPPTLPETVRKGLASNEPIRQRLPENGLLIIDRQLPFLFVYRKPSTKADGGTGRLIRSEASYLVAPGDRRHHKWVAALVRSVAETVAEALGAFLVIEIWSSDNGPAEVDAEWAPGFRIFTSRDAAAATTVTVLEKRLRAVKLLQKKARVDTTHGAPVAPPGLPPLLPRSLTRAMRCSLVGLETVPVYRDPESGNVFPVALRGLRRQLSRALKRAAHEFSVTRTTHSPVSYLALGRRGFVKKALEVDTRLSVVSDSFDFLLNVTPVNVDDAWRHFQRDLFDREPKFVYRPLPADPIVLKRNLYSLPTERIEDPALEQLYLEKQLELDRKLTLLLDRSTKRFLYGSLQLYGTADDSLVALAREILERLPPRSRGEKGGRLPVEEFAREVQRELDYYRKNGAGVTTGVEIRDDLFEGLLVSQGNLLIGRKAVIPRSRVQALLQHEIGTHVLTYVNGRSQPLRILCDGLVGYDELQEGLAVLSEFLVGGLSRARLRVLAGRVTATASLVDGASFVDTFRALFRECFFSKRQAFNIAMRVYRGGGLTKDVVYLRGLVRVLEYLSEGNQLEPLFVGKIGQKHIPVIRELELRKVLRPAPCRPRYLDDPKAQRRLAALRRGSSVFDLVQAV